MNKFRLIYQTFRGPIIVRQGPSNESWQILLDKGNYFDRIVLGQNPLEENKTSAYFFKINNKKLFGISGDVKPGTPFNDTKDTPSKIIELDSGKYEIFQESQNVKKYRFYGKHFMGLWFFNRESEMWIAERSAMISKKQIFCTFDVLKSEEIKKEDGSEWIVEGIISTSDVDSQNDRITDDALKNSVKDLKTRTTILLNHDLDRPIGKILDAEFKPEFNGIWIKGMISKAEPEIWNKIREGILNKFSIRFAPLHSKTEYNKNLGQYVTVIDRIMIKEPSVVSVPANANARLLRAYEVQKMMEDFLMKVDMKKDAGDDPPAVDPEPVKPDEGEKGLSLLDLIKKAMEALDSDPKAAKGYLLQALKLAESYPKPAPDKYPTPAKKDDPAKDEGEMIPKKDVDDFISGVTSKLQSIVDAFSNEQK